MKKFVNDPAKFVPEMLEGIFLANEGKLKYEPKYNLIYRADRPSKNHVSVIQGSGIWSSDWKAERASRYTYG